MPLDKNYFKTNPLKISEKTKIGMAGFDNVRDTIDNKQNKILKEMMDDNRGDFNLTRANLFDGVDDYVEIPHNAAQLGANLSNGFTISAWINARSYGEGVVSDSGYIWDKGVSTITGFGISFRQDSSKLQCWVVGANKALTTSAWSFGVWKHLLITASGTNPSLVNIYIDGVLGSAANQSIGDALGNMTATNNIRIGNKATATDRTFDGSIRSVKMWNRVLSASEITQDYAGQSNTNGLIHNFKLGGDYTDYGSVGVSATNSGSVICNTFDNQMIITQASTTGADPVLTLNQTDVSEEMIEFVTTIGTGNAIEEIGVKTLTTTHFIKVKIPGGLTRYIPCGTIA